MERSVDKTAESSKEKDDGVRLEVRDGHCSHAQIRPSTCKARNVLFCKKRCQVVVATNLPAGRKDVKAGYCEEHGGIERAYQEVRASWSILAPAEVGSDEDVLRAGRMTLRLEHSVVVIRHVPSVFEDKWIGSLGMKPSSIIVCEGNDPDKVEKETLAAWKRELDRRVEEIRIARGGTLDWGVPVRTRREPIILRPNPGESDSSAMKRYQDKNLR